MKESLRKNKYFFRCTHLVFTNNPLLVVKVEGYLFYARQTANRNFEDIFIGFGLRLLNMNKHGKLTN